MMSHSSWATADTLVKPAAFIVPQQTLLRIDDIREEPQEFCSIWTVLEARCTEP
jgi:hypothetical protein